MQLLDHFAVDLDDALPFGARLFESGGDLSRPGDLLRARPVDPVRGVDRLRMDQRFAIEAERAAGPAAFGEAFVVGEIVVDRVDDGEAVRPRQG